MTTNRLHEQLRHVIALEGSTEKFLSQQLANLSDYPGAVELLEEIRNCIFWAIPITDSGFIRSFFADFQNG